MSTDISRRTALVGGLTGAGLLGLAACSSGSGSDDGEAGGAGDTGAPGDTSAPVASGALADVDSIAVGEAVAAKLDGKPVVVARPSESSVACFSAICTHMGCTVAPAGDELHCPCHGSVFNATTGAVISGPATRALDEIRVTVRGGEIVAEG